MFADGSSLLYAHRGGSSGTTSLLLGGLDLYVFDHPRLAGCTLRITQVNVNTYVEIWTTIETQRSAVPRASHSSLAQIAFISQSD